MIHIDEDIRRAATPAPEIYTDPRVLQAEYRTVFTRSWQLVARAEQLATHGTQLTAELAGQPIVLVRDGDQLRGFHNVCRHRAGPVAAGCATRNSLQCRYHGWTYGLDGQLVRAPEMDDAVDFDPADYQLAAIEVEAWGPLVFAAMNPAAPLLRWLPPSPPASLAYVMRLDYELDCNWKVYVDNYLEGYHIPFVHPTLHKELDYANYRTEVDRYWSRQFAPLRAGAGDDPQRIYRPELQTGDAEYYWAFPNLMLNIYQGQLQTNVVVPLGHTRTRVEFEWYAAEPPADPATDPTWARLVELSDAVQQEDTWICEQVQRNLSSPACRPGRYSPRRENGVHHFHRLLGEFLQAG